MEITIGGQTYVLDAELVRRSLQRRSPRPLQTHWVLIDGVRWPPAQVLELALNPPRDKYTTHRAIGLLRRLGFETSPLPDELVTPPTRVAQTPQPTAVVSIEELIDAVITLDRFLGAVDLTDRLASLEGMLQGVSSNSAGGVVADAGIDLGTLEAALRVRERLGRVSDVVHACVIALSLPTLLEPGEVVSNRPSLAAGNDPSRPFDLETDRRIAEFKLSVWKGADAMRKRGTFKDLVALALDESGRRGQLFVVGDGPRQFLATSVSTTAWGLTRGSTQLRERFVDRWGEGALQLSISEYRRTHAAHVEVIDVRTVLPGFTGLD